MVVNALRWSDAVGRTRSWAFVVMPDHLHWLVQLSGEADLSRVVASVKNYSARRLNDMSGEKGSIWQAGFHDHALRKEEDLRSVARYVVRNPVRAGLLRSILEYPHWDACWI